VACCLARCMRSSHSRRSSRPSRLLSAGQRRKRAVIRRSFSPAAPRRSSECPGEESESFARSLSITVGRTLRGRFPLPNERKRRATSFTPIARRELAEKAFDARDRAERGQEVAGIQKFSEQVIDYAERVSDMADAAQGRRHRAGAKLTRWALLPASGAALFALVRSNYVSRQAKEVVEGAKSRASELPDDLMSRVRQVANGSTGSSRSPQGNGTGNSRKTTSRRSPSRTSSSRSSTSTKRTSRSR
jgi:hypothetical protein